MSAAEVALFVGELRRLWGRRGLGMAAGMLVAVVALQAAFTYAGTQGLWRAQPVVRVLARIAGSMGLGSPVFLYALARPAMPATMLGFVLVTSALWLPGLGFRFLAPAYAAMSVTADREDGRLDHLILTRMSVARILLAKGLAAMAPFLVLGLLGWLTAAGCFVYARQIGWAPPPIPVPVRSVIGPQPEYQDWAIRTLALTPLTWVVEAVSLIAISALCRRVKTAVVLGYFYSAAVVVMLHQGAMLLCRMVTGSASDPTGLWNWGVLALQGAAMLVLIACAVESLSPVRDFAPIWAAPESEPAAPAE